MKTPLLVAGLSTVLMQGGAPRETRVAVAGTSLYAREVGQQRPMIVLHGGPDFDHLYLLPEMDRFSDLFRLIYYDQRGRGKSAEGVRPEDVTLGSELADLDAVRQHFKLESAALLGHSWGAVLALEYALRHPTRVSQLVLMNPAPVSASDLALLRKSFLRQLGADMDRQREVLASAAYKVGDPAAVTARYRIHFKHGLARATDYEKFMKRMEAAFVRQGKDGIVKARAVEERLMLDTWQKDGYDLLPKLSALRIPTLVITGDRDFIPVGISQHIARAIPNATLVTIPNCGHFAYMECASDVRMSLNTFLGR